MDNPHASQFEFRPAGAGAPYVRMFDLRRPGDDAVWTGHYSRQGRPMLDGYPGPPSDPDPHMQQIADKLNEAAASLNEALRRV